MLVEWVVTILHVLLCATMVIGVLFSRTRIAMGAVLATLVLIFVGIRLFHGCAMDNYEVCDGKPTLADLGKSLIVKDHRQMSTYDFEQSLVGNLLIVHVIKIYALSIFPFDTLF